MTCSQLQHKLVSNSGMWVVTWLGVVLWLKLAFSASVRRMAGKAIKSINRYSSIKRGPGKLTISFNSMDLLNISFKLHVLGFGYPVSSRFLWNPPGLFCKLKFKFTQPLLVQTIVWLSSKVCLNIVDIWNDLRAAQKVITRSIFWDVEIIIFITETWKTRPRNAAPRPGTRILTQAMMPSSRNKSQGHNNKTFRGFN